MHLRITGLEAPTTGNVIPVTKSCSAQFTINRIEQAVNIDYRADWPFAESDQVYLDIILSKHPLQQSRLDVNFVW